MMTKIPGKIFSLILNILLITLAIIFILLLFAYVKMRIRNEAHPNIAGYTAFQVASGSMLDTIHVDDVVVVKLKKDEDLYKEQEIIVFKQDNAIITHRIVKINGDEIITKGDANNTEDDPITEEDIIGRVIKIIPKIAIWKRVLTSPEILFLIIITIILWGVGITVIGKDNEK